MHKNKLVDYCTFKTPDEARRAIFEYIEVAYTRRRRHQSRINFVRWTMKARCLLLDSLSMKSGLAQSQHWFMFGGYFVKR